MGRLVADIIVETLQNAGVKHCYGVVGDTLNFIARSLEKSEIEWGSGRHEEAGGVGAEGKGQMVQCLAAEAAKLRPRGLPFIHRVYAAHSETPPLILVPGPNS